MDRNGIVRAGVGESERSRATQARGVIRRPNGKGRIRRTSRRKEREIRSEQLLIVGL